MAIIRDWKKQLEDHYTKHYTGKIAQKKSSQMSHSSSTSSLSRSSSGIMVLLARDIMTIPCVSLCRSFKNKLLTSSLGSAVAVEHIFSGRRYAISLRRASLKPETNRMLMLVKQQLRLARVAIQDILGDE